MRNWYKQGSWNALCDVCGFKFKSHQLKKRWDGKMTCEEDFEFRHPSDLLRVPKDDPSVPWSRPNSDAYITVSYPLSTEADILDFITTESGVILQLEG